VLPSIYPLPSLLFSLPYLQLSREVRSLDLLVLPYIRRDPALDLLENEEEIPPPSFPPSPPPSLPPSFPYLQLSREVLSFEFLVLAHVGRDHALDLLGTEEEAQAEVVDA